MTTRMFACIRNFMRNRKGAVLPLLAVSFIPILISIGAAADFARAYMVQAKLQEAVDSAALAGRRVMSKDDIETARSNINAFMTFNFPNGLYDSGNIVTRITKPDTGTVRVEAETEVPTSILGIVGIKSFKINVFSEAKQNFDNIDIMLVLDTTGSMNEMMGSQTRLEALKSAVKELYAQLKEPQAELEKQGLRMRIGILPYSSTVNVGLLLRSKNPSYIQQTNVPYFHWRATRTWLGNSWSFSQANYNLTNFVTGGQLGNINNNGNRSSSTWTGCIEERATDNTITGSDSRTGPPSAAFDLDIDMIPSADNKTKWKPYIFDPLNGSVSTYCPSQAMELKAITQGELDSYLDGLVAQGSTYHDIGMIWGTRMISNGGVFGSDNPSTYKGRVVQKHIIFMTDGEMSAPINLCVSFTWSGACSNNTGNFVHAYSAWGIEAFDRRVGATSDSDNNARHTTRFLMACNEAKARQVSVWTIAFGTGPVDSLTKCASNTDQATTANSSAQLIQRFAEIGKNIGPLRLSK